MNYRETYVERLVRSVGEIKEEVRRRKTDEYTRYRYEGIAYDVGCRTQRIALVERVADDYVKAHAEVNQRAIDAWAERGCSGERPASLRLDAAVLDRLSDALLDEEISDTHPDKMTRNEYPIMSARQEKTRRDCEYSLSLAESYDINGVNRAKPERRHRIAKEERFIEKASRTKNRARNAQYKRDTSAGPLVTYNLHDTSGELAPDFVTAATTAEAWRGYVSLVY